MSRVAGGGSAAPGAITPDLISVVCSSIIKATPQRPLIDRAAPGVRTAGGVLVATRILTTGLSAALLCAPLAAVGADEAGGWFFGIKPGNAGLAGYRANAEPSDIALNGDAPLKLSTAYRLSSHFGVEASYLSLGRVALDSTLDPAANYAVRGSAMRVSGLGVLPVTRSLGVFGKLGASYGNVSESCAALALTCAASERGPDLSYSVGLRYDFTKTVSVRGEWARSYRFGDTLRGGESATSFYSIGMGFRF